MDLGLSVSSSVTRWLGVVWNELSLHSSHAEACLTGSLLLPVHLVTDLASSGFIDSRAPGPQGPRLQDQAGGPARALLAGQDSGIKPQCVKDDGGSGGSCSGGDWGSQQ